MINAIKNYLLTVIGQNWRKIIVNNNGRKNIQANIFWSFLLWEVPKKIVKIGHNWFKWVKILLVNQEGSDIHNIINGRNFDQFHPTPTL